MKRAIALLLLGIGLSGCATLQQLAALRRVDFRMAGIGGLRLAGVDLGSKRTLSDFGAMDAVRLTAAYAEGELPLTMLIDVEATNPADNSSNARFLAMDWMMRLSGKDTVSGRVAQEMTLTPGVPATIPVQVDVDLIRFFDENLSDLVRLVGGITGATSDRTEVELLLQPTIETPLGPMAFPEPVRIAHKTVGE